jgi:hypothetical protein
MIDNNENLDFIKNSYLKKFKKEMGENNRAAAIAFNLVYDIDNLECMVKILLFAHKNTNILSNISVQLDVMNNYMYNDKEENLITVLFFNSKNVEDEDEDTKLRNILIKIHEIKIKYTYSKYLDCLIEKDKIDDEHNLKKATDWLVHAQKQKCFVCKDDVDKNVKTECHHYICRVCIEKIKDSRCPECNKHYDIIEFFNNMGDDFEEDDDDGDLDDFE